MPDKPRIPKPTAQRLSLYLRELEERLEEGQGKVSSTQLGEALGLTGAQVRKDLACFGQFGQPGVGYSTSDLCGRIKRIMGMDRNWHMALVGVGNIGRALLAYRRFREEGFEFVAGFDLAPSVIGQSVGGIKVMSLESLRSVVASRQIRIGVIATPGEAAQQVADRLVQAGVQGILNFAPRRLAVAAPVRVAYVDFTVALEQLAFDISLLKGGGAS